MPRKSNIADAPLHEQLLHGLTYVSRADGSVHTVKSSDGARTCAEICVGLKKTRINFRNEQPAAARKLLSGTSATWKGGGAVVTDANVADLRAALVAACGVVPKVETAAKPRKARKPAERVPVAA